jgi:hypothetical protein
MLRLVTLLLLVAALVLVAAAPAAARHGETPHDCLGEFHSENAGPGFGEFVAELAQEIHPFGSEFVSGRAQNCP